MWISEIDYPKYLK